MTAGNTRGSRGAWTLALGLTLGGCGDLDGANAGFISRDTAQPLGTLSRARPADDREQALTALAEDAWRREHRFLDAVDPGYLFRSTRVRQVEIDAGLWNAEELYQLGGQLFSLHFSAAVGMGGGDQPAIRRFHEGRRGGPDATRCVSCHWRGGLVGAGDAADNAMLRGDGNRESSTIPRNPPALIGAGVVQRLAEEMSIELRTLQNEALAFSAQADYALRLPITAKGVDFGFITVHPDGEVEHHELQGVDSDLIIKPFGWKGTIPNIRDAAEDALLIHHGMQSETLVIVGDESRVGPFGGDDPDGDGVVEEILEGQVTALTLFLAMQELPQEQPPEDSHLLTLWARGRRDFETLGCADCHTPSLVLDDPAYILPHRYGGSALRVDLSTEGVEPRVQPDAETGEYTIRLYSDLKRHDMGEALTERRGEAGVEAATFITPPLWGLARSRPYLHDGRAATIEEAILLHGGEAARARDRFASLSEVDRAPLRIFLTSLTRARRLVTQ
ncbi:MAG: di-heme oxidoredictase family protein [Myxococcota bacterium]